MKTQIAPFAYPTRVFYDYDDVTCEAARKLMDMAPKSVSAQSHAFGMYECEPIIIALDALIVYARAHKQRFESPLAEDYVLGPAWLKAITGIRALCDGDGAAAHIMERTTDSKDNGTCETMFWDALELAGFTEADI